MSESVETGGTKGATEGEILEEEGFDAEEAVRALIAATEMHDRGARAETTARIDAEGWEEAGLLLAAAKEVLLARAESAMKAEGEEEWLQRTAREIVAAHRSWMRLVHGQVLTMLRAGCGRHDLAVMVRPSVRGRLDATCVQFLTASGVERGESFLEELDEVLREARELASRPVFVQEFSG